MKKIVVITGIPGSGKTTICKEVERIAEEKKKKIKTINFGTIMVKLASEKGKELHRDDIRKHSIDFQQKLQIEAAKKIIEEAKNTEGTILVDTHMVIRTKKGYFAGLPNKVLQILNPEILILIEATPEEILTRRFKDANRKRDKILEEEVLEELSFSRFFAASCASLTGAPVKIIKNPDGKQLKAAKEIFKLLEE